MTAAVQIPQQQRQMFSPPTPPQSPILNMSTQIPSIGDILLLSQIAWRTARAFTSGRKGSTTAVPSEFQLIEMDLNHLSKVLKQLAEYFVLENVDGFVSSDKAAKDGIGTIIMSCRRTLDGLDAFTAKYQTSAKTKTGERGGFTLERQWNPSLLANYDQPIWGGDDRSIINLHDMLRMHAVTVTMLKVILEKLSREGLETGVIPIAEKIIDGYKFHASDLNGHLAEIRGLAQAIVGELPSPTASTPATLTPSATPRRLSIFNLPPGAGTSPPDSRKGLPELTPVSTNQTQPSGSIPAGLIKINSRPSSQHLNIANFSWPKGIAHMEPSSAPISPMTEQPPGSLSSVGYFGSQSTTSVDPPSPRGLMKRAITSTNLSTVTNANERHHKRSISQNLIRAPTWGGAVRSESPEAIDQRSRAQTISGPQPIRSGLSLVPSTTESDSVTTKKKLKRHPSYTFEKLMFRNAVILCDVHATTVDYTLPSSSHGSHHTSSNERTEVAMRDCRIRIIRKKRVFPDGQVNYSTSIWSFSDDHEVRLEQQVDETQEIIPYSSFFEPKKVSITIPTTLIYHSENPKAKPIKILRTKWLNYYFATPECASEFQTLLYGKNLRASFKTEKTVRVHEGLASMIAPHEQMCAMENLRVWDEEETGAALAIVHYSAMFRPGYMKFYLNDAKNPIVVKDESTRAVRIKGLKILLTPVDRRGYATPVPAPNAQDRNGSVVNILGNHHHHHQHHHYHLPHFHGYGHGNKVDAGVVQNGQQGQQGQQSQIQQHATKVGKIVSTAKIEFSSEAEKQRFLGLVKDVQKSLVEIEHSLH